MSVNEMTNNIFSFVRRNADLSTAISVNEDVRPEAILVERICNGDSEAFNELYKKFAPMVHGIILARVPRDEVEDIAQEVFLSAYKSLQSLRDRNSVGAWLAMIARNSSIEFYRRVKSTEELSENVRQKDNWNAEAEEILSTIRSLPDTYRETLVLRLVEGMTGTEISELTGITPESVRVNLHRGMKLLRQKLGTTD